MTTFVQCVYKLPGTLADTSARFSSLSAVNMQAAVSKVFGVSAAG